MDNTRGWVLVIGVLLIFALSAFGLVWVVRETIQQTVEPVQQTTGSISTRVAEILNPTPTILPNPVAVVAEIRTLARLETIEFTVEKVITAETRQGPFGFLFGDKLIFVAHGQVIAGVDMSKLRPEDLSVKDGVLYVRLPDPEVFVTSLDNQKSYVYNRDTGVLTKGDLQLESTARQAAEVEIQKTAEEDGILRLARQNAETYLYGFLRQLGFPEVIFIQPTPAPILSPTKTPTP